MAGKLELLTLRALVEALSDDIKRIEAKVEAIEKELRMQDMPEESISFYKKDKIVFTSVLE